MAPIFSTLWTKARSMGLTFLLGFLLCIFQSSESILVKLAGNRPDPHPSSAKLLFLSELLKFIISYSLLCVERKQLVGVHRFLSRRPCCRPSPAGCCRNSRQPNIASDHRPIPLRDENEEDRQLPASSKRLLSKQNDDDDDEEEEEEEEEARRQEKVEAPSPSSPLWRCSFPSILLFAVPGAIYFFNNNLTFVLLSLMPAPTYVVLSNLKILTTGLFSYLFLHRLLTTTQWVSLGILFLSTAVSQIDLEKGLSLSISIQAFFLMVLFCSLSAAASVFSEYVMKERFAKESIHLQNMKLYMFGILFNGITYLLLTPSSTALGDAGTSVPSTFSSDMAPIHYMIILAYASLGLVTSAIIKFSGSITKVYASSMSMFFAALVSWLLLKDQPSALFFVGCLGCCFALHLYYRVTASSDPNTLTAAARTNDGQIVECEERRNSNSSSSSSITLTVISPVSETSTPELKDPSPRGVERLTSIKIMGRAEYTPLDSVDDDDDDENDDTIKTCRP